MFKAMISFLSEKIISGFMSLTPLVQNTAGDSITSVYKRGFLQALNEDYFKSVLFDGVIVFVIVIILFFLAIYLKKVYAKKVQSIQVYGMNYNDIENMQKTGLLSEEEIKKIKTSIARKYVEMVDKKTEAQNASNKIIDPELEVEKLRMKHLQGKSPDKEFATTSVAPVPAGFSPAQREYPVSSQEKNIFANSGLKEINLEGMKELKGDFVVADTQGIIKAPVNMLKPKPRGRIIYPDLDRLLQANIIQKDEYIEIKSLFEIIKNYPAVN